LDSRHSDSVSCGGSLNGPCLIGLEVQRRVTSVEMPVAIGRTESLNDLGFLMEIEIFAKSVRRQTHGNIKTGYAEVP
jgi:hypothetical protein